MKKLTTPLLIALLFFFGCSDEETESPQVEDVTESELMTLIEDELKINPNARGTFMTSFADVQSPLTGESSVGKSLLVRYNGGVAMAMKTSLTPGYTATIWWIFFNNPGNCSTEPCGLNDDDFFDGNNTGLAMMYATGNVVNRQGKVYFVAKLREGQITESINSLLGQEDRSLEDSKKADFQLVLRSHGPKIPGQVKDQISSYFGGCSVNFDPFTQIPDESGECGDIQVSVHGAG